MYGHKAIDEGGEQLFVQCALATHAWTSVTHQRERPRGPAVELDPRSTRDSSPCCSQIECNWKEIRAANRDFLSTFRKVRLRYARASHCRSTSAFVRWMIRSRLKEKEEESVIVFWLNWDYLDNSFLDTVQSTMAAGDRVRFICSS